MKKEGRKKITANELYLNECMSILYTKIRATGIDVFDADGNPSDKLAINVESYNHGTVTYLVSPNTIRVNFDGTNFAPLFKMDEKSGSFMYRLKPLGMEYLCKDRALDEAVHEKKVMITIGKNAEYYRYLACGTFFILLEYCSKDDDGKTIIINDVASEYSDKELINYFYEAQTAARDAEIDIFGDGDDLSDDEKLVAEEVFSPNLDDIAAEVSKKLSDRDLEEIEAYSSDEEYSDICDIDFSLADILKDKMTEEPYACDYPTNIEDFDYQEYIRTIKSGTGEEDERIVYSTGPSDDKQEDDYDDLEDGYDEDEEYGDELDETSTGDLYSETDTITDGEGFIEDSIYKITRNGEDITGQMKCDILDTAVEGIMDVDQQVGTLKDYYWDIYTELRKIRAIILKRKERVTPGKKAPGNPDPIDGGAGDDIENR